MNALVNQCKKRGNGLPNEYLQILKEGFQLSSIDEVKIKDGISYFPSGKRRNARIGKIAFENKSRIFLEFNYVNLVGLSHLDEFKSSVWKLADHERKNFHAGGVM